MDEIPVAQRKVNTTPQNKPFPFSIFLALGSAIITMSLFWLFSQTQSSQSQQQDTPSVTASETVSDNIPTTENNPPSPDTVEIPENILGHLGYEQAPMSELKSITADGRIKLRTKAAEKFLEMQSDARRDGITLVAISGFRTIDDQEYLFFNIKEQRKQETSKRAEVSAPPGYSEHHTGYAVDIGDGNAPATNLNTNFEQTAAFRWLEANAAKYSFELSFPEDNLQGISYEPWHWRFVGDTHSLETFYKARELKTNLQPQM
ncbi:M15 family metallopeptidase [Cyanobacterium aponinum UTEX 3222]|uniref:D-alanyl-D-alanine carboxypeptidase family protein n=1 Tax=Cyanobacterium aponinum AL20115 TaxID=3090662 RepID=A0AAF0ZKN1_9CHRO|nr:D-alanyl-D-alanine carboxypeptidase family protein [Cyanobacterium aponinum]WPF90407.1 D-alanyl-D-alanine carboxypeptidase family protein [Cyanobacterium aponinum AL20115]WRL37949.1 M15 family metallopeptidase [Cyanobacterium aponinum UTEX 3221]WRL44047.1 M15 family metallopeptidase [Cyanobacterium aponinum UTEX 3222]